MKKTALFLFLASILTETSIAQTSFKVETFNTTPEAFSYLLLTNEKIAQNDTINEKILDLVEPMLTDSMIEKRIQHHKIGPVGGFISAFGGFNWRAVSMKKQKFVGTVYRHSRSGEEEYTEYDINFDLRFHLKKYLWRVLEGYDRAKKYHKQDVRPSHRTNYDTIPYVRDTNAIDIRNYRLHCEHTPHEAFRPQLNYTFFPTLPGYGGLKEHPNFENENPTMGFYGVFCNDCNHNCGPELHPYEWVWWMKANEGDESTDRIWHIGLFHEGSNRLKKWSVNPLEGSIKIPFAIQIGADENDKDIFTQLQIKVEHLCMGGFTNTGKQKDKAENKFNASEDFFTNFGTADSLHFSVLVSFPQPLNGNEITYRFTHINFDPQSRVISGYMEAMLSAIDIYTTRITFNASYEH